MLDDHTIRASSWTDSNEYRGKIRRDAQQTLKKLKRKRPTPTDKENEFDDDAE